LADRPLFFIFCLDTCIDLSATNQGVFGRTGLKSSGDNYPNEIIEVFWKQFSGLIIGGGLQLTEK